MSLEILTQPGYPLPPAPRHAVTVHMPLWQSIVSLTENDPEFIASLKGVYPRIIPHADVKELTAKVIESSGLGKDFGCLLFSRPEIAIACKEYATSEARGEAKVPASDINIRTFQSSVLLHVVFFPVDKFLVLHGFWVHTGTGISTRLAERCLNHGVAPKEVFDAKAPELVRSPAHVQIQDRIAILLERAPVGRPRSTHVSRDDVYLYPTGMATLWSLHSVLSEEFHGSTALVGMAFKSTPSVFREWGAGYNLFAHGHGRDLPDLKAELRRRQTGGLPQIQAVWTEFPANPLLTSADLKSLRILADKHNFALIIDDTIGSYANIDVLGVADAVVTSLTKSFSGYADVMAGAVILNPSSRMYSKLRLLMGRAYHDDLWTEDAEVLERNSRDYLERSRTLNRNAKFLADFLQKHADDPASSVASVLYPSTNSDRAFYEAFMREPTADFTPGYGCLLAVEFESIAATIAFYDNLPVHQSPSFGAHLTIALPYAFGQYAKELDWAAEVGMKPTQIRIGVGLEDQELLKKKFEVGLQAADAKKIWSTRAD